jgi:hypothetical protein
VTEAEVGRESSTGKHRGRRAGARGVGQRRISRRGSKSTAASSGDNSKAFRVAKGRCRPLLPHERAKDAGSVLTLSKGTVTIAGGFDDSDTPGSESPHAAPRRSFPDASSALKPSKSFTLTFDHMYDEYSTHEVYAQYIAPFTAKFLAGHTVTPHVTPFAEGEMGTGKTHTVIVGGGVLSVKYDVSRAEFPYTGPILSRAHAPCRKS